MLTLHPITSGLRDGRHQDYPTPGLAPYDVPTTLEAEETACMVFMKNHAVSFFRLADETGTAIRIYRRSDFFQVKSPLGEVHHRIVERRLAAIREESAEAARLANAGT